MTPVRPISQRCGALAAMIAAAVLAVVAGASAAASLSFRPSDSAARPQAPQLVIARADDLESGW
jgi:hypothetical protein